MMANITRKQKNIVTFCHNFVDDIGTDNHYLPWSDEAESSSAGGRYYLAMPYSKMKLLRLVIRTRTVATPSDLVIELATIDNGDAVTAGNLSVIGTCTVSQDASNNHSWFFEEASFTAPPIATQTSANGSGKLVSMRLDSTVDPGSSTEWYISSIWEVTI
jgi:hypothetical protein